MATDAKQVNHQQDKDLLKYFAFNLVKVAKIKFWWRKMCSRIHRKKKLLEVAEVEKNK